MRHSQYLVREGKYEHLGAELTHVSHVNMPTWARDDPLDFWRAVDEHESANGRLYVELEVALPRELSLEEQIAMAHEFAQSLLGDRHPYTLVLHDKRALDGGTNPHFHLMFNERLLDGITRERDQFCRRANHRHPERGGAAKTKYWQRPEVVVEIRQAWERHANLFLAREGYQLRIDSRSLEAQGIERRAEPKLGPRRTAMLLNGQMTETAVEVFTLRQQRIEAALANGRTTASHWMQADEVYRQVSEHLKSLEQELASVHQERIGLGLEQFWGVGMWRYPPPLTPKEAKTEAMWRFGGDDLKQVARALEDRAEEYTDLRSRLHQYEGRGERLGVERYVPHLVLRRWRARSLLTQEIAAFNARSVELSARYEAELVKLSLKPEVTAYARHVVSGQERLHSVRQEVDQRYTALQQEVAQGRKFAAELRLLLGEELLVRRVEEGVCPQVVNERAFQERVAQARQREESRGFSLSL